MGSVIQAICRCNVPENVHEANYDAYEQHPSHSQPPMSQSLLGSTRVYPEGERCVTCGLTDSEQRMEKLELWIKIGLGLVVALIVLMPCAFYSLSGGNVEMNRRSIHEMDLRIQGLEKLWSKPEITVLNAKYTVLVHKFEQYSREVHEMARIYENVTDIKAKLGSIHIEIDEIRNLKNVGNSIIHNVNNTIKDMHVAKDDMESRFQDSLRRTGAELLQIEDAFKLKIDTSIEEMRDARVTMHKAFQESVKVNSLEAAQVAKKATVPAIDEMQRRIHDYELQSTTMLQAALKKDWDVLEANVTSAYENAAHAEKSLQAWKDGVSELYRRLTAAESQVDTVKEQEERNRQQLEAASASAKKMHSTSLDELNSIRSSLGAESARSAAFEKAAHARLTHLKQDAVSSLRQFNSLSADLGTASHQFAAFETSTRDDIQHLRQNISGVGAKVKAADDSISSVLELASAAKRQSEEAYTSATSALTSIEGVGFIKKNGGTCPRGTSECILWHWMSPEKLDPYCTPGKSDEEWAAGNCKIQPNGENQAKLFGCCRQ